MENTIFWNLQFFLLLFLSIKKNKKALGIPLETLWKIFLLILKMIPRVLNEKLEVT